MTLKLSIPLLLALAAAGLAAPQPQVTTISLPDATVGEAYDETLSAKGGGMPYSWSLASGQLPGGLSLSGDTISGTPAAQETAHFSVEVTDKQGESSKPQPLTIKVNAAPKPPPLTVTTGSLPDGTAGSAYSAGLAASGGTGGYTWSVSGGSLPAGLSLSGATIGGTPTAPGNSNFTVQVKDSAGATATQSLSITVTAALTITTGSLPAGVVGAAYSASLAASGGTGSYNWSISSGSLPTGLALNGANIAGSPT